MENKNEKINKSLQNLENNLESLLNKENLKLEKDYLDAKIFQEELTSKYQKTNLAY